MVNQRKIKILRIISRMNVGGPAWQVSVLTRGLDSKRFETLLLSGHVESGEADYNKLKDPDLPIHYLSTLARPLRPWVDLETLGKIRKRIRQFQPDIVHTHTAKAGVLGRIAARMEHVPLSVHTFHGHLLHGYFSPLYSQIVRLTEKKLSHQTNALVAVGERVRDELLDAGIGTLQKFSVIPPGAKIPELISTKEARESTGLPTGTPIILFVGRLTNIKRPDRLIEAFIQVKKRIPNALLVIAGEGDQLLETKKHAQPLGDSVQFFGWHPNPDILYLAADVVVITSDNEGMPVTLIEAALAGKPTVTTNVGSAGEVVDNNRTGYVVPAEASAIAEALIKILKNPKDHYQMGEEARSRASSLYSTKRLITDHENLYSKLIKGSG